jgi:hypothetical protein
MSAQGGPLVDKKKASADALSYMRNSLVRVPEFRAKAGGNGDRRPRRSPQGEAGLASAEFRLALLKMPRAKAQGALRERKISPVRRVGPAQRLVLSGKIDRMGLAGSHFEMKDADG